MALIAACTLEPGVYLSMNIKGDAAATVAKVTALGFPVAIYQMQSLAQQIVRDGEGAKKFVTITVTGAPDAAGVADGLVDGLQVIAIFYVLGVPAVSCEPGSAVFGESQVGRAFDGHVIVVVQVNQLTKFQVAG